MNTRQAIRDIKKAIRQVESEGWYRHVSGVESLMYVLETLARERIEFQVEISPVSPEVFLVFVNLTETSYLDEAITEVRRRVIR